MAQEVPHDLTVSALKVVPDSTNNDIPALEVSGRTELGVLINKLPVVSITTATYAVTAAQSGTVFTLNKADGIVVTLPAAAAGLVYEFHVGTTVTSNALTINAASDADTLQGTIVMSDKDDLDVKATNADATTAFAKPAADDHQLSMDGATKGGFLGTHVVYKCITDAIWSVSGSVISNGNCATPFT